MEYFRNCKFPTHTVYKKTSIEGLVRPTSHQCLILLYLMDYHYQWYMSVSLWSILQSKVLYAKNNTFYCSIRANVLYSTFTFEVCVYMAIHCTFTYYCTSAKCGCRKRSKTMVFSSIVYFSGAYWVSVFRSVKGYVNMDIANMMHTPLVYDYSTTLILSLLI